MNLRCTSLVAGLLVVGALGACSDSEKFNGDGTEVSTTTESSSTTTSVAESTTTSSLAPETTPAPTAAPITTAATIAPPVCPSTASPSGAAVAIDTAEGDWNGDGVVDSATSWGEPTGTGIDWFVRMQVGASGSTVAVGDLGPGFAQVLDRADVDFSLGAPEGSNEDELLAIVGSNAAGYNLGVFGVSAGCAFQFDDGGGSPYVIPIHYSVSTMSGLTCDGGAGSQFLVRLEGSTADAITWQTHTIKIERVGEHTLVDGVDIEADLLADDSALNAFNHAGCNDTIWVDGPIDA